MMKINLKELKADAEWKKNVLYEIKESATVKFIEEHNNRKETVDLVYCLSDSQFGLFAHEYRSPSILKEGCKAADILACVVDKAEKEIVTFICDVKSNISAFSDDLGKEDAMLTAINDVRRFHEQIHAEILHKNSFMIFYLDEGYKEIENIGIVTENFESSKFLAVAKRLEYLFKVESTRVPILVDLKLKKNLAPYMNEVRRIRDFAGKIVRINEKEYPLSVYLLNKVSGTEYVTAIELKGN